jgi:hypothetical protein
MNRVGSVGGWLNGLIVLSVSSISTSPKINTKYFNNKRA